MSRTLVKKVAASFCLLLPVLLFQNCGLVRPAETLDLSSTSAKFEAAKAVLQKNCTSCHVGGSLANLTYTREQDFITSGLVTAGNIDQSKLIFRIHNYSGSATGARNMPPSGALSSGDYQILVDWVEGINSSTVACAPNEHLLKPQIKRLTRTQFINSVRNAFGSIFADNQFPTLTDGNPRIGLSNDPDLLGVNEVNINAFYDSSLSLATTARGSVADLTSCANSANDNCLSTLITNYGLRLWRRPVTAAESNDILAGIPRMTSSSASRAQKVEYVLLSLLVSPNHLFRTELGAGTTPAQGIFQLTQYEVASLLSFAVWDSPPDATLLNLAQTNQLYSVDVLKAQVQRMVADSKVRGKMSSFVTDLLKIEDIKTVTKDASLNLTSTERDQLYSSAQLHLNASYSSGAANLLAPFTSQNFYANQSTARFFNLNAGGLQASLSPVSVDSSQRFGILSHPAFLTVISGQVSSGIVRRGVFALEQLLCHHLPPPPANVSGNPNLPPGFDRNLVTSREELRITHSSQSSCVGCHSVIDPAGFGFENFNSLGQFRLVEKAANVPIDSSGRISGVTRQEISFGNSVQYFQSISANIDFKSCVQKSFFKYTAGQDAKSGAGRCEYQNFEQKINTKGNSILSTLESLVELDSFIRRRAQ